MPCSRGEAQGDASRACQGVQVAFLGAGLNADCLARSSAASMNQRQSAAGREAHENRVCRVSGSAGSAGWDCAPRSSRLRNNRTDSLAEAARRAREQKKDQAKATKVWDDDNIPKTPGDVNVVGQPAAGADRNSPAVGAPGAPAASGEKSGKDTKALQASLAGAKDKLQSLKTSLDILKRTYDLDSQMYLRQAQLYRRHGGCCQDRRREEPGGCEAAGSGRSPEESG